jgi:hypothetical protein
MNIIFSAASSSIIIIYEISGQDFTLSTTDMNLIYSVLKTAETVSETLSSKLSNINISLFTRRIDLLSGLQILFSQVEEILGNLVSESIPAAVENLSSSVFMQIIASYKISLQSSGKMIQKPC